MDKFAAILLSRQALRPTGAAPWVRECVRAIEWIKQERMGVVSSVGMQTWELITALASINKIPLRLMIPVNNEREMLVARATYALHFGLDREIVEFVPVIGDDDRSRQLALRDATVVRKADVLVPVSLRQDGSMVSLIAGAETDGKEIWRQFTTPYEPNHDALKVDYDGHQLTDEIRDFDEDYLIHWTRAANHAWPDERLIDYYSALINSQSWPRSAFETLRRIVESSRLIASSLHMPSRIATVSFSALRPVEALPLMKWRARYSQMTFEPYGIGLPTELAERSGVKAVHYYDRNDALDMDPARVWLWQSRGAISDWTAEREHRHRGDLMLRAIPPEAVILFCRTREEAAELSRRYHHRVIPFFE